MTKSNNPVETIPNGPDAAAILAAGIGCALVGILALAGDASDRIGKLLNIYNPVGTLSGVTTLAIIVWLVSWFILNQRCGQRQSTWPRSMWSHSSGWPLVCC
jgi:hypothetical protein